MKQDFGNWLIQEYNSAAVRGRGMSIARPPSQNAMVMPDEGGLRAFLGMLIDEAITGGRLYFNTDQSFAGLGTALVDGSGNVFTVKDMLHAIGTGQVTFDGDIISGFIASSTLSYIQKTGDDYIPGPLKGPFQAGHAQPSAPIIYAKNNPSPGQRSMVGAVALKIWRVGGPDGQPSLASLPSNVLVLNNQSIIAQYPLPDSNGQLSWENGGTKIGLADLGVFRKLPTNRYGQVLESVLSYTRSAGACSIASGDKTITVGSNDIASADIGRRIAFGGFDSWIESVNSSGSVEAHDEAGANYSGAGTITHAVDGITRALELSWSTGDLLDEPVPDKAFPPPAGQHGGVLNDALFVEADNIIYIGDPGFNGSFPPRNAIFPNEAAVRYLRGSDDVQWRLGKHSIGVLAYVGGTPAIEYQLILENVGIVHPQNCAIGSGGRLLIWSGKPMIIIPGEQPNVSFAQKVYPDFEGWNDQSQSRVIPGFDGFGQYEVWCKGTKINAMFVPTGQWCAPVDISEMTIGPVVSAITHGDEQALYLTCSDGAQLAFYRFDAGTGSVMVVQTDDFRGLGYGDTVSEVGVQVHPDNTTHPVRVELIKNYSDDSPRLVHSIAPTEIKTQWLRKRANQIGCAEHAIRVTMTSTGGEASLDRIESKGEANMIIPAA